MPADGKFTICCLFFGHYEELAMRLLRSLETLRTDPAARQRIGELRLGLNVPSESVVNAVRHYHIKWQESGVETRSFWGDGKKYKYPRMRQMFYEPVIRSEYAMWFDDDSYLDLSPASGSLWLDRIRQAIDDYQMLGSRYTIDFQGQQREWIKDQWWYRGKDLALRSQISFCQGAWWVIRTKALYELNYPWPELQHNGGDTMLGEAMYQFGWKMKHFRDGVHINADEIGRESKAKRRGFHEDPIGASHPPKRAAVAIPEPEPAVICRPPLQRRTFRQLDI
jgi:hypothetical protein